jgi:hypothetical protein
MQCLLNLLVSYMVFLPLFLARHRNWQPAWRSRLTEA